MGTQGPGRKRIPNKDRLTAEDDALNVIAREAEARLAAKRSARAEAREIRMKELERQQKEIYQVQKKYSGLDNKWGDIEQWMEESERYSRHTRRHASISDDEERMSVSSRGSIRSDVDAVGAYGGLGSERGSTSHSHKKSKKKKKKHSKDSNGYDDDDRSTISGWSSKLSDESRTSRSSRVDLQPSGSTRSSRVDLQPSGSTRSSRVDLQPGSLYEDSIYSSSSSRRYGGNAARVSSEYSGFLGSSSRTSSRASSACASPVEDCGGSVASFLRSAASTSGLPRDLDHVTIPDVDDRLERDYLEKGSRASSLSSATLASLGGTSSRRGSGDTSITADTEASIREIKEIHELKDQIQDVEAKYMQSLKELKDTLTEMEEKYRKAMVSNAQLDNDKCNLMYQVDIQKDSLMELEELLFEIRREYEEKAKELEREKHAHSILQFQFNELKHTLKQSEELLTEIRQLHLQQEGNVREIADLQETLEWKDKKIGALERQKEYSDAIRNERDELRDEVVQLKDILKKHGIVLGPDLSTNGETGESVLDGPGQADTDTKTSPTEGSSILGRSEEKQSGVVKAVEGLQANQLDEAVPQNHLTSPSPSGPASVVETCQSEEPGAPPIGNKEEIESGNTINAKLNNLCDDTKESVHLDSLVSTGSEEEVTREDKVGLDASGSSLESCKPPEDVKEMGSTEVDGLDPKAEGQLDQKVEEVCAGEPATETSGEVEEISVTDTSENGNVIAARESIPPVPEIIVSIDNSDQSEEKSSERASEDTAELSSSRVVEADKEASHQAEAEASHQAEAEASHQAEADASHQAKTEAKAEAVPVSEEEAEGAASQTPAKPPQSQGASASSKKKKKRKKGKQKQKGGVQSDTNHDKDSKLQETSSLSKDPGQKTGEENLEGKAEGSCVESIQESPVSGKADTIADERPLAETKDDAPSEDLENVPCLQASTNTDDVRDTPEPVSIEHSETHPNPESDNREHPSGDLESSPDTVSVTGDTECITGSKDLIDTTEPNLSEDKDYCAPEVTSDNPNNTVAQSNNTDEQENTEISVDVSEPTVNTDVSESCQDQQVEVDGLPCDTLINAQLPIDPETQLTESELNVEHQSSGDFPKDTDASDCPDNELVEQNTEGCPAFLTDSADTQSKLDGSESVETSGSQSELTLHSIENTKSQDDTTESPPDTGRNDTETQPNETEEASDACIQSGEIVQHLTSTDGEREQVIQDPPAATSLSDDFNKSPSGEANPETNNDAPVSKAEEDEEDEVGEEFQFEDQDLEAMPESSRSPPTERTEEERACPVVEAGEEHEGHQGQDQESNGCQEQSNVEEEDTVERGTDQQQEGRGKTEDEQLEIRQDPKVTGGEEGSAGEEHKTEETNEEGSSEKDQSPAKNEPPSNSTEVESEQPSNSTEEPPSNSTEEQPSNSTEVESEATEKGEAVSRGRDPEGAGQVVEVESGQGGGPTGKDSKKGGKKNKGKGKEDCKMS